MSQLLKKLVSNFEEAGIHILITNICEDVKFKMIVEKDLKLLCSAYEYPTEEFADMDDFQNDTVILYSIRRYCFVSTGCIQEKRIKRDELDKFTYIDFRTFEDLVKRVKENESKFLLDCLIKQILNNQDNTELLKKLNIDLNYDDNLLKITITDFINGCDYTIILDFVFPSSRTSIPKDIPLDTLKSLMHCLKNLQ